MKTIMCYGDSNTHGFNPSNGLRYSRHVRWTGILAELLGTEYHVIEEGCNGRTTIYTDPFEPWKNGKFYLKPCLNTHKPIDLVILMLGSNDLKKFFANGAGQAADGAGELVDEILEFLEDKQGYRPQILLVSPIEIGSAVKKSFFKGQFDAAAMERSKEFPEEYARVASEKGVRFFNAAEYAKASDIDGLHMDPENHKKLAEAFYHVITEEIFP